MRARTPWLLVAASLVSISPIVFASSVPPKKLKYVDGHWTAWDPPANLPEGAQVHRVERGDTFWDLAKKHLGNPYLWPQIWEKNQYVLDAHWIYPGDPIVLALPAAPPTPVEPAAAGAPAAEAAPEAAEAESAPSAEPASVTRARDLLTTRTPPKPPVPVAGEDDVYCAGFIGGLEEPLPYQIVRSEFDELQPSLAPMRRQKGGAASGAVPATKLDLSLGDLVYLNGGRNAGLGLGQVLTVIEPGSEVVHPVSGSTIGRIYRYRGRIRVVSVSETEAMAEIVHGCSPIRVGMAARAFVPQPVPLARRTMLRASNDLPPAESLKEAPIVLGSPEPRVSLGQHDVVFIDRGEDQDVLAGDVFTVYRVSDRSRTPVVVGEVAIIAAERNSALAKVLESRYPIFVGDRLERK